MTEVRARERTSAVHSRRPRWREVSEGPTSGSAPEAAPEPGEPGEPGRPALAPWCRIVSGRTSDQVRFGGGSAEEFTTRLDALKARLPFVWRTWEPRDRAWMVRPPGRPLLLAWARRWFAPDRLQIVDAEDAAPAGAPANAGDGVVIGGEPWATLWLLPGAPPEVIKAAYRALALLHHPDRGGSPEMMQRLNTAYAALSKR